MRYFISVDVNDEDVKENIVTFMDKIEQYGDIKTVAPENLHITLLFLGKRSEEDVHKMKDRFVSSCEGVSVGEFRCSVSGVGVFPHMNYINTIWIGAKPDEKLRELHMNFSEGMNGENEHEFTPHITVGRVRGIGSAEKSELQEIIRRNERDFGTFEVENVRLKASELGEDGPTYKDVEVWAL